MATSAPATWSRPLVYVKGRQVMRGPDVEAWQARLSQLGYTVTVDGRYGPATAAATRELQAHRGLLVTGCVDKTTHANGGRDLVLTDEGLLLEEGAHNGAGAG
ncbi:hypothetical protein GCM10010404_81060 [Nonomuraea africana]|uniref:Peptidoglycan hydrolase-like protein with peptidoglycan-binding domain n=1 Tax=Nonomuraea africana TaxID=46171 RepID=A0ABR9KXM1_9ACTN|nr:peptidoglycan-binding domain-containing protein [Nonomuraea africana]MBE1566516.1 peptidoglycan hydrolase-like protein with peptidoglycan-binding domain [Nonomuraea africana]